MSRPRILLFTGEGAGKTSAALGKALRLVGRGRRVAVIQFLKGDPDIGELPALARLGILVEQHGLGFVPPPHDPTYAAHRAAAERGLARAWELAEGCDALVLDEVCGAVAKGLLAESAVLALLAALRPGQVVILTGRDATPGLIARADTVSELRCIKHALAAGIVAEEGVER